MKSFYNSIFLLFYLLLFSVSVKSQDLNNLDRKFGFNKFKLESPFNLYQSQLKYLFTGNDKVKYYEYSARDIGLIFDCIVEKVRLGFYNQKLYTISIDFIVIDNSDEIRIQKELKSLFGYQRTTYDTESSPGFRYEWAVAWKTEKTFLQASKFHCENIKNPCGVEIFLFSQKIRNEIQNNKF